MLPAQQCKHSAHGHVHRGAETGFFCLVLSKKGSGSVTETGHCCSLVRVNAHYCCSLVKVKFVGSSTCLGQSGNKPRGTCRDTIRQHCPANSPMCQDALVGAQLTIMVTTLPSFTKAYRW
jgi:hypothetical protein